MTRAAREILDVPRTVELSDFAEHGVPRFRIKASAQLDGILEDVLGPDGLAELQEHHEQWARHEQQRATDGRGGPHSKDASRASG